MKNNIFKSIFRVSNKIRVGLLNTLFWAIIIGLLIFAVNNFRTIERGRTLFIQPGIISDSSGEGGFIDLLTSGESSLPEYTVLSDLLRALELAQNDDSIDSLILDLDYMVSVGYGSAEEIGLAIERFKRSGKPVYAFSSYYNQGHYYLASFADEISMDPYGELSINGISQYRNYWKNFLDRFNVDVSVFRAGDYKSYVEPYISDRMSEVVKNQNLIWMNSLWDGFISDIKDNRSLNETFINNYFSNRVELIKEYDGNMALFAEGSGLVDFLETREQFFNKFNSFYNMDDYLMSKMSFADQGDVGIVNINGTITYSDNNPGSVSALDIEQIIDDFIWNNGSGLIVRLNSGGGSVFASELIRRKVAEAALYMPVVVSMGDVCASGGYWIATAGDVILTNERTITGSIGVFGMLFGFEDTLKEHLGIENDGVATSEYAGDYSLTKNLSDEQAEIFQLSVDNTYNKFLNLVSVSRQMDIEAVGNIAGGRVWSGIQSKKLNLSDTIGGLYEAKEIFREELGNDVTFQTLKGEPGIFDTLYNGFSSVNIFNRVPVVDELSIFERIDDPSNIYAMWY